MKLSSNLIWDMMMIPCGRRRTSVPYRDFRWPSSLNIVPVTKTYFQNLTIHQRRPPFQQRPRSATLARRMKKNRCLAPVTQKRRCRLQNVPAVPRLPARMDIAQQTSRAREEKRRPSEERSPGGPVCASLRSRNAHGHVIGELLHRKGHQIRPAGGHLE